MATGRPSGAGRRRVCVGGLHLEQGAVGSDDFDHVACRQIGAGDRPGAVAELDAAAAVDDGVDHQAHGGRSTARRAG